MNSPYGGGGPRNPASGGAPQAQPGGPAGYRQQPPATGYGRGVGPGAGWPGGQGAGPAAPAPAPSAPPVAATPPIAVLIVALVLAVAGIGVAAATWGAPLTLLGWLLAGPLAIGALTAFSMMDTARRAAPLYDGATWVRSAQVLVTVLIVAGVIVSSISIAMWVGRL